jgi:hypothetical protein
MAQAMKLALHALLTYTLFCWIAAAHLSAGFAAEQEGQDGSESESVLADAEDSTATTAEPSFEMTDDCCEDCGCESCVGQSCSTCGGACSFFDPPRNACGEDPRIYRSALLGRLWVEADYLAWASSPTRLPPLVTDNTSIVFGNANCQGDLRSGGRLTGGYWLTPEHTTGVEASFFEVDGSDVEFLALGDEAVNLARPIINAQTGLPDTAPGPYVGAQLGGIAIESDVDLLGAEALLRQAIVAGGDYRLDGVAGYRYQRLFDRLLAEESFVPEPIVGSPETIAFERADEFLSRNEFHGGEFGLVGRWWGCRWALQALGKVALGGTYTTTTIDGRTLQTVTNDNPGIPPIRTEFPGGVLALPSNMGRYTRSELAAVGELGVRLEYAWNKQWRVSVGYTFLYWSRVARVTDSIDLVVDPSQIPLSVNPTASSPSFAFRNGDFWAQGLNAGLHIDF